jgi:hypothetical protein
MRIPRLKPCGLNNPLTLDTTMQAIRTRFIGPTATRPARIIATGCPGQRLTLPYEHGQGLGHNHLRAAQALATRLGWPGRWVQGETPEGYVWTCLHLAQTFLIEPMQKSSPEPCAFSEKP